MKIVGFGLPNSQTLCRHQARHGAVGETSAGVADSGNAIIGACPWPSSLLRVGRRICVRGWLFLFTKPWRQIFQRGLSVADRCLEHHKMICALGSSRRNSSGIRKRFRDCLNGLHHYHRHQGNYHHEWSDMHGLPPCLRPLQNLGLRSIHVRWAHCYERTYLYAGGQGLDGGSAGDKKRPGGDQHAHGAVSNVGPWRAATTIRRQP